MKQSEAMAELKRLGAAQNVKIYRRHGAGDNLFGVSFANLRALAKQISTDQDLAEKLWNTANADARCLATMILDTETMKSATADAWVKGIGYYLLSDLVAGALAKAPFADTKRKKWCRSRREFVRRTGYSLICSMLVRDSESLADDECRTLLATIETEIHGSANLARHAMNMALISVGIYKPTMRNETIAMARRIGPVEVDHGETGCRTPPAEPYILKAEARSKPKRPTKNKTSKSRKKS